MKLRLPRHIFLGFFFGLVSMSCFAQLPSAKTTDIRLGVGGVYEFYLLDGVWFTGGGPSAEINFEMALDKKSTMGLGARYRILSALGTGPTAASAAVIEVQNIDYFAYLRLGWLEIFGGMTQLSGKLILVNETGREIQDSAFIPHGGLSVNFISTKQLKGRVSGIYAMGDAFGYSVTSIQMLATLSVLLP